ncbi:MAG: hypothetical protein HQ553_00830 [Chloroflexi bacterium]|nr:hypothetical protein [Chloroflexota bacterium]
MDWTIDHWVALAQGAAALGTFTLAIFAYKSIKEMKDTRKEERKEKLLQAIIDWSMELATLTPEHTISALPPKLAEDPDTAHNYLVHVQFVEVCRWEVRFLNLELLCSQLLPQTYKITPDLYSQLYKTWESLKKFNDEVVNLRKAKEKELALPNKTFQYCFVEMGGNARALIDMAAGIKAK